MMIETLDLFLGMSEEFLAEVNKILTEKTYNQGDQVFKEGRPGTTFYVIVEGSVKISFGSKGYVLDIVTSGEIIGWSSLLEKHTYTASAECLDSCRMFALSRDGFNRVMEKHPDSGMLFFRRLSELIANRYEKIRFRLLSSPPGEW
jgi:CRP/FNR family cyclic AMP-dependent transcriptional regulator